MLSTTPPFERHRFPSMRMRTEVFVLSAALKNMFGYFIVHSSYHY